jgi:hypothetical protein
MNRRAVWIPLALIGLVAGILAMLQREPEMKAPRVDPQVKGTPGTSADAPSGLSTPSESNAPPAAVVQTPPIIDPETDQPMIPPLPLQTGELGWEARIRSVLSREKATEAEKARGLLQLLPTIPAEGAETCAEEAVKRLPNEEYRHAQAFVTNPGTYGLALGVLFSDLMERPDNLRLPTLVTIARNSAHPYAAPARDNLELLLGQDFGEDWPRWDAAVREKLNRSK